MPMSGGAADKLGNRYEILWAIDQLLGIVDGRASSLTLEPPDPDESKGVEFIVRSPLNTIEYWSVKRQTTRAAGWTLGVLTTRDDRGRTILGDLLGHVEQAPTNCAVFASTLGAGDFEELRSHATSKDTLEARLDRSKELKEDFHRYVLPLCDGDMARALSFLQRCRSHATDEAQLRERVSFAIRKLVYAENGSSLDSGAVRGHLADLLLDNLHRPVDKEQVLGTLAAHGFRQRDWAVEKHVRDRMDEMCNAYTSPLQSQRINGVLLSREGTGALLAADNQPIHRKMLVVGGAGSGKSTTLADMVERLRAAKIPVLPIRFDQLPEGILTTTELGRKLLLPESPVLTLAGVASGSQSVLIVDQLDAVSIASGRRADLWSLFERLRSEAEQSPGVLLVVGCREFDLEHDHRMRMMKAETSGFSIVTLKALSPDQIDAVLRSAGMEPSTVQPTLKPVLVVPLHLSMFLSLPPAERIGVHSRDELLDMFWTEGERRTRVRLGRMAEWTRVIDKLTKWLSSNQQLSAPRYILDDFSEDASAMASEHVLVLSEDRYRFFHESFFDYAFARRFATHGGQLLELLLEGEQHLFRRGQVRQVLAYLRTQDWSRYLVELWNVLGHEQVRFHIKRLLFQWLSALPDPKRQEWELLQRLLIPVPGIWLEVRSVVVQSSSWFDVLDSTGYFDKALSSGESQREEEAVWMLRFPALLKERSGRVAALLRAYRAPSEPWNSYLRYVCRNGEVYHSREMFDLFLSLIDEGVLDGLRPGFAVNDNWWSVLYSMAQSRPEMACETIGHWFDRAVLSWRLSASRDGESSNEDAARMDLARYLDQDGRGSSIILAAASSHLSYVEQMLPRVAGFVNDSARDCGDCLMVDPLWSSRSFGDRGLLAHSTLLSSLARSLEILAESNQNDLDRFLEPYIERSHDAVAYLVLRAWTAAPELYADRLARYLAADSRRLKVGYASWSSNGGSAALHVSSRAVQAASSRCSPDSFSVLERTIISLTDDRENKHPRFRGTMQLTLLESLEKSRLSTSGKARLEELRRKFPKERHEPPVAMMGSYVGSPIPEEAHLKMSDEQWLRAMRKYAGVNYQWDRDYRTAGGERELCQSLEARAKAESKRFAALAKRMPDDLPASYFGSILRGVAACAPQDKDELSLPITAEELVLLVRRVHELPGRPCGRWIAWLVEKWSRLKSWPDEVIDVITWYVLNDPDPHEEVWRKPSGSGFYYGGDPYEAGINSTRGAIAEAIAGILFNQPGHLDRLQAALHGLGNDRTIAVRSCAIRPLLAVLNSDPQKAISWFVDCISVDPVLLETPLVESFLEYAGYRDYDGIRPVVHSMLESSSPRAIEVSARQVCLLALDVEAARMDVERVHRGTSTMRKAAAEVYSTNVSHEVVGSRCRQLLRPFLADPDGAVRAQAALAFRHLANLSHNDQAVLLTAFLEAGPEKAALEPLAHALESSPVQLPDLVCRFAELCIEAYRTEAGDISTSGSGIAMYLSKIVVRLYAQTEDSTVQSRCLDMIDEMERYHFLGVSDELKRLDR
jgi:hypothetical protein